MPYLQPAKNNYFGFMPATNNPGQTGANMYLVSSSEANAINPGDAVIFSSIGTARVTVGAWSTGILGIAASAIPANGGSTAATVRVNSSQMLLVYDDPEQVFVGCDTTSGVIGGLGVSTGKIGMTYAILSTGAIGSTGPSSVLNRSVMAISGNTGSTSALFPLKLIGLHPVEQALSTVTNGTAAAAAECRKWLVQLNLATRANGFAVVTT